MREREMEGDRWTAERGKNIEKERGGERETGVNWSLKIKGGRDTSCTIVLCRFAAILI